MSLGKSKEKLSKSIERPKKVTGKNVPVKPLEVPKKTGKIEFFRLQTQRVFFTYKTHINFEKLIDLIGKKYKVERWLICHENADVSDKYEHTHAIVEFTKTIDVKNSRLFDFKDIHPNFAAVRSMLKSVQYCIKESLRLKHKNWKANFDVEAFLKANVQKRCKNSGEIKDLCDRISKHGSAADAIANEASSLKDVLAIKTIYDCKNVGMSVKLQERYKNAKLKDWQSDLFARTSVEPTEETSRKVRWVVDVQGNKGKSFFCSFYKYKLPNKSIVLNTTGTIKDMVDVMRNELLDKNNEPWHVMIDLTRTLEDRDSIYTLIEILKTGSITCTKYKGGCYQFFPPHVTIFANWLPKCASLSLDRWIFYYLHGDCENPKTLIVKHNKFKYLNKLITTEKMDMLAKANVVAAVDSDSECNGSDVSADTSSVYETMTTVSDSDESYCISFSD